MSRRRKSKRFLAVSLGVHGVAGVVLLLAPRWHIEVLPLPGVAVSLAADAPPPPALGDDIDKAPAGHVAPPQPKAAPEPVPDTPIPDAPTEPTEAAPSEPASPTTGGPTGGGG